MKDPRFSTNALRVTNREALIAILSVEFAKKSQDEWCQIFGIWDPGTGVQFPSGPILDIGRTFTVDQVKYMGLTQMLSHRSGTSLQIPGPPLRYLPYEYLHQQQLSPSQLAHSKKSSEKVHTWPANHTAIAAPELGEHTIQVLQEVLQLKDEEIAQLERDLVIEGAHS